MPQELIAVVENLESVSEAHKDFYVEKDGKFVVNIKETNGYALENIAGLRLVTEEAKAGREKVKGQLAEFETAVEVANKKIKELEASQDAKSKDQIEALKNELETKYAEVLTEKDGIISTLTDDLKGERVTGGLIRALGKHKATENGLRDLPVLLSPHLGVDENKQPIILNASGGARIGKDNANMTLDEYVEKEVVPSYPEFFQGVGASGSGSPGGSGGSGSAGKGQISRAEYDSMSSEEKHKVATSGTKIVD
jgi:hypothetical protein